jgi:parvulin-like peptidyl-prolyl isomerase
MQKQVPTKAPARSEAGRRRIVLGLAMGAVAVLAFCWGRSGAQQPPAQVQMPSIGKIIPPAAAPATPSDYSRRVVAHIYGTVPITREDLGEYLIARFGAERIENFVNRRIIEVACQSRGITVSDAEVEAALGDDLKGLSLSLKDFEGKVLKAYGKTLTEWKEDVLRPKLALTKFCRIEVKVTEDDLKSAFEAHYGDKVECRMILLPKDTNGSSRHDFDLYDKVRKSDAEFDSAARAQAFAPLAAKGGLFPAIWHNYPEPALEKEAFSLKPGEVSKLLTLPDGSRAILKCVQHIPRDTTKRLEGEEREKLYREVTEARLTQMVPQLFKQLRDQANPQIYMKRTLKAEDLEQAVRNNLAPPAAMTAPAGPAPTGVIPASGQQKK